MSMLRRSVRSFSAVTFSACMVVGIAGAGVAQSQSLDAQSTAASGSLQQSGSSLGSLEDLLPGGKAPKNIIYMIGDGMGYNHVANTNIFETGQSRYGVEGEADGEKLEQADGEAVQVFESDEWQKSSMSTYPVDSGYDPVKAWNDNDYINHDVTDSAAAGTAMATGQKTLNGMIGVDAEGKELENTNERALSIGKSAGVVSSVPFNHATPAAWGAHNSDRNALHEMADEMIDSDLNVIFGAGHPDFDDNATERSAKYEYLSEEGQDLLESNDSGFDYFDDSETFADLAAGNVSSDRYFGLAPVATTLQQNRDGESSAPGDVPENDVTDLPTMSTAALNVLNQDPDGFQVMIEGGAIDWTGHANESARNVEETQDFNAAVEAVNDWVEKNSNWDETLVIVTADHETGFLSGEEQGDGWKALHGPAGQLASHQWYSGNHTNQLVPVFVRGAGADAVIASADKQDPVRGSYIDNTTIAKLTLENWWTAEGK